jgi:hypothetical protein
MNMRRLFFALLIAALTLAPLPNVNAGWLPLAKAGAGVTLSLDPSGPANNSGGTTTQTLTISTTLTNNIIIVMGQVNDTTDISVTSSGLTWTRFAVFAGGPSTIYGYWALATGVLLNHLITVNFAGTASFSIATAFAVNGAKTSAPFDTNAALPMQSGIGGTLTTTASNTMLIAALNPLDGSAQSGWPMVSGGGTSSFWLCETKIVSSPQTATAIPSASGNPTVMIGHAIVQGP